MTDQDSFREKLRILSLSKRVESWIPIITKLQKVLPSIANKIEVAGFNFSRTQNDQENSFSTERMRIPELDTEIVIQFNKEPDGTVIMNRHGMPSCIETLLNADLRRTGGLLGLWTGKEAKAHLQHPIELFDDCISYHPIFGVALLVEYLQSNEDSEKERDRGLPRTPASNIDPSPDVNASEITRRSIKYAEHITTSMNIWFDAIHMNVDDELTRSFIEDMQKDMKALIYECLFHISFMLHDYREGNGSQMLFLSQFQYPVKEDEFDYWSKAVETLIDNHLIPFGKESGLFSKDVMDPFRHQNPKLHDVIYVPFLITWKDITIFLRRLYAIWMFIADSIEDRSGMKVNEKHGLTYVDFENGVNIMLRPRATKHAEQKEDARLSINVPFDGSTFNIRIDRDAYVQSVSLEHGRLSLPSALTLSAALPALWKRGISQSFFDVEFNEDRSDASGGKEIHSNDKAKQDTTIGFNEMAAYLVSVVMSRVDPEISRVQSPGQSISYHRRENVAKEEYYENFSILIHEIKKAFEKMRQRG